MRKSSRRHVLGMNAALNGVLSVAAALALSITNTSTKSYARDIDYEQGEVTVYVTPGEPTIVKFPSGISKGIKKKHSTVSVDKKDEDLIVFANEGISESGEVIVVSLQDGNSYSVRLRRASDANPRDDIVAIHDSRASLVSEEDEDQPYKQKEFGQAPATKISGLMREMILISEFGKTKITGYKVSDRHKGQTILNDGTMNVTIDRIIIGPNLWGYVLDAENLLEQSQKVNPATFRVDGTRAISVKNWELAPKPLTVEQQISNKHKTKVYVITRKRI